MREPVSHGRRAPRGFPYSSVGYWLTGRARRMPAKTALQIDGRSITYGQLEERAARCAGALKAAGTRRGDRVAAYLDNSAEYVELLFACARLGAILVPLSTRLTAPELEFLAADSGSSLLVHDGSRSETVAAFRGGTAITSTLSVGEGDDSSYEDALGAARPVEDVTRCSPHDVLAIFYTSGTTGQPKGAMLTHGNFFWTNLNMVLALGLTESDRSLVALPMFHVGGWNINTLSAWLAGGSVRLERSFSAERVLNLISESKITVMMGVPTLYGMLADHPDFERADLESLRLCVCGGAPLPVSLIRRYHERGVLFTQGYGLTEAAPNCLFLPAEDAERKAGAAGRPYFFADVRVVDGRDRPVSPGDTGEVVVRGPSVMKGYWNRPEATAEALRGGWLRTGDVGRVDEEGDIWIVDRVKDMYISGGENVYPAEIENVLAAHPAVAEAAIIGVPHEKWGEVGLAVVALRPGESATEDDLRAFCAERLAKFKVPASVVFTESLPRNATGKLFKPEIRERFAGMGVRQ